jgi:hypothetical protein
VLFRSPTSVDLKDLKAMLESNPTARAGIEDWFKLVYE